MSDSIHLHEVNLVNNNSDNTAMTVMQLRDLFSKETRTLVREAEQQIQQEIDGEWNRVKIMCPFLCIDTNVKLMIKHKNVQCHYW
jgi:hypothetical protein